MLFSSGGTGTKKAFEIRVNAKGNVDFVFEILKTKNIFGCFYPILTHFIFGGGKESAYVVTVVGFMLG